MQIVVRNGEVVAASESCDDGRDGLRLRAVLINAPLCYCVASKHSGRTSYSRFCSKTSVFVKFCRELRWSNVRTPPCSFEAPVGVSRDQAVCPAMQLRRSSCGTRSCMKFSVSKNMHSCPVSDSVAPDIAVCAIADSDVLLCVCVLRTSSLSFALQQSQEHGVCGPQGDDTNAIFQNHSKALLQHRG